MRLVCCVLDGIEVSFRPFWGVQIEWKRARTRETWERVEREGRENGTFTYFANLGHHVHA